MKKIYCLFFVFLVSCGAKKELDGPQFKLERSSGFVVTHYSIAQENNWIPVHGIARLRSSLSMENESGRFLWEFANYKDQFGNCTGSVSGNVTPDSIGSLGSITGVSNNSDFDINNPYITDPNGSINNNDSIQSNGANFTSTSFNVSDCPFGTFTTNQYAIYLYDNGDLIVTDYFRGIDYFMRPAP